MEGSAGSIGVSHAVARMTQLGDSSSDSDSDSDSRSGSRSDSDDSERGGSFARRFDGSACVNSHSSGGGAGGVTDFGNPCSTLLGVDPFEGGCPVSGVNSSLRSRWNAARIHSGSAVVLPSPGENDVSLRSPSPGENDVRSSSVWAPFARAPSPSYTLSLLDVPAPAPSTARRRTFAFAPAALATDSSVGSFGRSSRSAGGASSPRMAPRSAAAFALSSRHGAVDLADDANESSASTFRRSSLALRTASRRSRMKSRRCRPSTPPAPPDVVNGRGWFGGVAFFAAFDANPVRGGTGAGDLQGRPLDPNAPAVPVPLRRILRLAPAPDEGDGSVGVRIRAAAWLR